jgi:TM2 domain-containing membrane protein YozV
MTKTIERDPDEHYDRRQKGADETFCSSCGAIIKKDAEICPKCGVRNKKDQKLIDNGGKSKGSVGWLIFWILVFWPIAVIYGLTRRWN